MNTKITGFDIWRLPEFKALCDRIGIDHSLPIIGLVIDIPSPDELVKVTYVTYLEGKKPDAIDNTNLNNVQYRTHQSCQRPN